MSRFTTLLLAVAIVISFGVAASAQSKQKAPSGKVYTNDDIPSAEEPAPAEGKKEGDAVSDVKKADGETAEAKDDEKDGEKKDDASDPAKAEKEWKSKFTAQQEKVSKLEKEQQLADREYKLRAAVFFADAGARLRDDKKWADEERKHKDEMAKLDTDLKAAKEKLDEIRENARKAGVKVD